MALSKICSKCKMKKSLEEFHPAKRGLHGKRADCKICKNKNHAVWMKIHNTADRKRKQRVKYKYGLDWDTYTEMYENQGGKCYICRTHIDLKGHTTGAYVDHNHKTEEVRSLLCQACNAGLGLFRESIDILQRAIDYIKKFN